MSATTIIDPDTGAITLAGAILTGAMPLAHLLQSPLGNSLRKGPTNQPFEWFYLDVVIINNEPWSVSLCFREHLLETVTLSPGSAYDTWSDYSEAHERIVAAKLRALLRQWLLRAPSLRMASMEVYRLPWGSATAGFVPQDATASIGVRYDFHS